MASLSSQILKEGKFRLVIKGRLDADGISGLWPQAVEKVSEIEPDILEVDASAVDYCDGAGIGLLLELKRRQQASGGRVQIVGLRPEFTRLMQLFDPGPPSQPEPQPASFIRIVEEVGRAIARSLEDVRTLITFVGELTVKLFHTLLHPHRLRWAETFLIAEKSGADAIGITALLGFLIGLILAFQSATAMRQFGAHVFAADLLVITLFRELGPLITAFVLASRSGSAFAAELGTMKVNEELDALTTMGLDPVKFLVVPRVIAVICVIPLLTMFNHLFGLIGGGLVMASLGFPPVVYIDRIQQAVNLVDLAGGLVKTFVFGALIAGIGCMRGLQTGTGASAVGDSATRAVVTGIVAIVVADGIFAVVYYYLGI